MKLSKEFKVGTLVLTTGLILYFGFNYLKTGNVFSSDQFFTFKYPNAQGLLPTNPVNMKDKAIGKVKSVEFLHDEADSILITIAVDDHIKVSRAYSATISSIPVVGVVVDLQAPDSIKNNAKALKNAGYYEDGDEMRAKVVLSVQDVLTREAVPAIQNAIEKLNALVGKIDVESGKGDLKQVAVNFKNITANLDSLTGQLNGMVAENRRSLKATINNTNGLITDIRTTIKKAQPTIDNFNSISDSLKNSKLKTTIASANDMISTLTELLDKMQNGDGSMSKLLNDPTLHDNINEMVIDLNFLVADMQANPHRYVNINVFGKKPVDSDIIKRIKPKKVSGAESVTLELKRNVPNDLVIKLYDMTAKKTYPLQATSQTSSTITISIPADLDKGEHAIGLEWNRGKDSDYISIEKK